MKICPICETENKPQATHCEVCGERLDPAAPGEELSPEESVMTQLAAEPPPSQVPTGGFFVGEEASDAGTTGPMPTNPEPHPVEAQPQVPEAPKAMSEADLEAAFANLKARSDSEPAEDLAPKPQPQSPSPQAPKAQGPRPKAQGPRPQAPKPESTPRLVSSGIPDARLVVYQNKQPTHTHPVVNDETLIGRYDPISGSYPDLDLTEFDAEGTTSRKHAYIYRMGGTYYLYPVSNAGTQLNSEMVDMGQRKKLKDGDVIILAATLAMKFHIDE